MGPPKNEERNGASIATILHMHSYIILPPSYFRWPDLKICIIHNTPSVPKYKQNWSTKVNVVD